MLDTHFATINWGDGTTSEAVITESNGSGSLTESHKYTKGGIFDVKVSLSDDDNGINTQATKTMIAGAGINGRVLQIVGTAGKDNVEVQAKGKNNEWVEVKACFLSDKGHIRTFKASDFDSIVIMVGDDNDHVTVDHKITKPVLIDGGAGNDYLMAGGGAATLLGGEGNDKLIGSRAGDRIFGGNGNDVIFGVGGNDLIDGGSGNDVIFGSCGDDTILGGDGNDWIFDGSGNDVLDGGNGNDVLFGGPGNDILIGGAGNDTLFGGSGNDGLDGGPGNDRLFGGRGNDKIFGGEGNDLLVGGPGKDTLDGGGGHDRLIDWHGNYCDSFVVGHRVGNVRHLSSPSWVSQFVVNLGSENLNPNSDIRVVITGSVEEQLTGFGGRRKSCVG